MKRLLSPNWYRYQAVLVALVINERLYESEGEVDPKWATVLFKNLLGLGGDADHARPFFAINPLAFPQNVRVRLRSLANRSEVPSYVSAQFREASNSAAVRTAKLISTLVHSRAAPPRTLWRIAREELSGSELPPSESVVEALEKLIRVLSGTGKRADKLRAITAFGEANSQMAEAWPALEPALVQPLIDWVPAVFGEPGRDSVWPGLMMPLMIDVTRGLRGSKLEDRVDIVGSLQNSFELGGSVAHALRCACALWRNRFSNAPAYRLAQVAAARVRVDLQLIEGIAGSLSPPDQEEVERIVDVGDRLYLAGRSLELPVALAIYGRLVGSRLRGEIRASGVLGNLDLDPQDEDEESGDTYLEFVEEETAKALATEVQLADCFILPVGSEAPAANVPAVFALRLGSAVDFSFDPGCDGHRFVRAADVAASFKGKPHSNASVVKVRDQLSASHSVFEFSGPLSLMVQALFQISESLGPRGFRSKGRYTFVRVSPTERADAAWATIWSALDGDPAELEAFVHASTYWERAQLFAKQMARNQPTFEDPRWSPHVLVVIGVSNIQKSGGSAGDPHLRFDIRRIMKAAGPILLPENSPCDPRLRCRLGQTRIVLIEDEGMPRCDAPVPKLEPDLRDAVEKLSAFRYGFTFAMARRQLGTPETPLPTNICSDILTRLGACSYGGEPLLIAGATNRQRRATAPTAFEFMLRWRCPPADRAERQANHERAGHAIVPILHASRVDAHLELAAGLNAPWIDEAYAQLSEARSIAVQRRDEDASFRLWDDRLDLLRRSGTLVLERLPVMMGKSGRSGSLAVYEDFVERLTTTDHPSLHARAAAFATTLAVKQPSENGRKRLFDSALRHLRQAMVAAKFLKNTEEREAATFLIATERCRLAYVGRDEPDAVLAPFHRNIRNFVRHAIDNLSYMREIFWGEWFSHAGGMIRDDRAARSIYEKALWNDNLTKGIDDATLIGWAGTLGAEEIDSNKLELVCAHISGGFWERINCNRNANPSRSGTPLFRFAAGLRRLRSIQGAMDLAERRRTARQLGHTS